MRVNFDNSKLLSSSKIKDSTFYKVNEHIPVRKNAKWFLTLTIVSLRYTNVSIVCTYKEK